MEEISKREINPRADAAPFLFPRNDDDDNDDDDDGGWWRFISKCHSVDLSLI